MVAGGQLKESLEHILAVANNKGRFGVCSMLGQDKLPARRCPVRAESVESVTAQARQAFDDLVAFCGCTELSFWEFEKRLFVLMAGLGRHWCVCF